MASELFLKRVKNIVDASSLKEPEKVPVGLDYIGWPYAYAGVTLEDVVEDPVRHAQAYCKFLNDIPVEYTMNTGHYVPYDVYQALGSEHYKLCADKTTVQHAQAESSFIEEEEYDILIKDPGYFMKEYFPKRNVPIFKLPKEEAYERLKEAARRTANQNAAEFMIRNICVEEHDIVPLMGPGTFRPLEGIDEYYGQFGPFYFADIDTIFDFYRGMMGTFEDLAENRELLDEALAKIHEYNMSQMPPMTGGVDGHPFPMCFGIYHCAPFLSPPDYDKYWFQPFKHIMMPFAEAGKKIYIKGEGAFSHTIEKFKEMPKGSVIIQLDADDPFEMNKKIGGYQTLMCGIKTADLNNKDIQTLKDDVKRVFDELAPGGGFMFYQDKPLLSPADAKAEVVKEVWEFANEYSYGRS